MSESTKAGLGSPSVSISKVEAFISSALTSVGIPVEDERQVAGLMAETDAYGGDAHGIFRLQQYVTQSETGGDQSAAQHPSGQRPSWHCADRPC